MNDSLQRVVPIGADFTESWSEWDDSFKSVVLASVRAQEWRLYPQTQPIRAQHQFAEHLAIDPARIEFTRGADAAVDSVMARAASRLHDVFTPRPAYPGYDRAAIRHGVNQHHYPATHSTLDVAGFMALAPSTAIITWPGNPIGTQDFTPPASDNNHQEWILDATYVPMFSSTFSSLLDAGGLNYDIIFSSSKTYGLAGVRLGGIIHKAPKAPTAAHSGFNLDYLQLATADALTHPDLRRQLHAREVQTRALQGRIIAALEDNGRQIAYSAAASFTTIAGGEVPLDPSLHAKTFQEAGLTRITTCPHNLTRLT